MNEFMIPAAFRQSSFEYKGTDEQIKEAIKSDLRLHAMNSIYEGYTGNLRMAIEKMAKVITKAEFDEIYKEIMQFSVAITSTPARKNLTNNPNLIQ